MEKDEIIVAIAFDLNFRHAASIFSGMSDYLQEAHLDWRLMPLNFGFEAKLMELAASGKLTAAIGTFVSDGWVEGLINKGVTAINMFNFSKIKSIPNIVPDDFATGVAAADHLLQQGLERFAFYGADGIHYTQLRAAGFAKGLGHRKLTTLQPSPSLKAEIEALCQDTQPIGFFCSNDFAARELILIGKSLGLICGKDLLIVGVDDDPTESIFAGVEISSFKQPIRETGYVALKALHELLRDGRLLSDPTLPMPKLIARESSLPTKSARIAQRAIKLIEENIQNPTFEVGILARTLGVSRRALELNFQNELKTSPYQLMSQLRLAEAQRLLKATPLAIMEVGRLCGYVEQHHFSSWFKKQAGCSPKSYRAENVAL